MRSQIIFKISPLGEDYKILGTDIQADTKDKINCRL